MMLPRVISHMSAMKVFAMTLSYHDATGLSSGSWWRYRFANSLMFWGCVAFRVVWECVMLRFPFRINKLVRGVSCVKPPI